MYPYNFKPNRKGINHQEIFVVMPFNKELEPVFEELIKPATDLANQKMDFSDDKLKLSPHRTKEDIRMTSGWINVLEHLTNARIVIGVLTGDNPNVFYELGIAHATQPLTRQILIASEEYKPTFDTKDLIYFAYNANRLKTNVDDLSNWIVEAYNRFQIESDKIVKQAVMQVGPYDFGVIMQRGKDRNFGVHSNNPEFTKQFEIAYGEGSFEKHMTGMSNLCKNGLLGLNTAYSKTQNGVNVQFSFWWTSLGNDVLFSLGLITEDELKERRLKLPDYFK